MDVWFNHRVKPINRSRLVKEWQFERDILQFEKKIGKTMYYTYTGEFEF